MTKAKRAGAKARSAPLVAQERPRSGGSFIRERATGALRRVLPPLAIDESALPPTGDGGSTDDAPPKGGDNPKDTPPKGGEQEA